MKYDSSCFVVLQEASVKMLARHIKLLGQIILSFSTFLLPRFYQTSLLGIILHLWLLG